MLLHCRVLQQRNTRGRLEEYLTVKKKIYQGGIVELEALDLIDVHSKTSDASLTIEKAVALTKRPHIETAKGVRCVIKCRGMTGYGAQYFSTKTKQRPETKLAERRP